MPSSKPDTSKDKDHSAHSVVSDDFSFVRNKYQSSFVELANDRLIFLTEDFTKQTASEMTALLLHYNQQDPTEEIYIYIHSSGGDAAAMLNIIDIIDMIDAPVNTVCMGKAYSAGAFLLMSGAKRIAFPHSEILLHGAQVVFPVPGKETALDSVDYGKFLHAYDDKVMRILSKASGRPLKEVKKDCEVDLFLDAKQALAYGVIDTIIGE
jgi:ATP-dependent Clp protease, protease subunit